MGIPENPLEACNVIIKGNIKEIDLGKASLRCIGTQARRAGDHYFTLMAGIGFDAEVVATVMPEMKKLLGSASYLLAGIKTLAEYKATRMSIGLLDICIFKKRKRLDLLHYTFKILTRRHASYPDVESFRAKKVRITAKRQVLVHTDCEIIPTAFIGMEFTVLPISRGSKF